MEKRLPSPDARERSRSVADTAFSIAAVRAEERARPEAERLFDDPYAHLFAAAGAHAADATQRFLDLPAFRDGVRIRTRFIDDAVREALAAGLEQVVLLGAGFDARGLRMHEIRDRGARVFEVDTVEQLERKREALAAAHVELPPHVVYVPFDFETPSLETALPDALEAKGFRRGAGAIFVWEGVIGYIGEDAIDRSLRAMVAAGGAQSRVVFTFGAFDSETATNRTRRAGFRTCQEFGGDVLWRRYLSTEPHPNVFAMKLGVATV